MKTESTQLIDQMLPEPRPQAESIKPESAPVTLTLNFGEGVFSSGRGAPPPLVILAFGTGRLHSCVLRSDGGYDFFRATEENSSQLVRSFRDLDESGGNDRDCDVIFQFGEKAFLCGDRVNDRIISYASSEHEAESIVRDFDKIYALPPSPEVASFELIRLDGSDISSHTVPLENDSILTDDSFALHYPEGMELWHNEFKEKLTEKRKGLSILEGKPGTGKTSYLRHLMGILKESHHFYFIPPGNMGMLSNPQFIKFWAHERESYENKKLVVILEDADAVLMARGSDNRDEVSALLNLSDGMLGDFLSLHIICTINCRVLDIDQALLRPGRLICHRKFNRLNSVQASRLAAHLGRSLPLMEDYSLAEVFAGEVQASASRQGMGFGG